MLKYLKIMFRAQNPKLKQHKIGFLEKGTNYTQVSSPSYRNKSTYVVNIGWGRILPLKMYNNFKTWETIVIFYC